MSGKLFYFVLYCRHTGGTANQQHLAQLGRGDARSQHDFFGIRRSTLVEKKGICVKQAKEKGELYLKLGLLAGLAFVILIV